MANATEKRDEEQIKLLSRAFSRKGIKVRREKLSRGSAFKVKSGNCHFFGADIVFIDSRLSMSQQLAVMLDYAIDLNIELTENELPTCSIATRKLFLKNKHISLHKQSDFASESC